MVYIVRNPFDSIISLVNLQVTNEHNGTASNISQEMERKYLKLASYWKTHINYFIGGLNNCSQIKFADGIYRSILVVRYEDLVEQIHNYTKCFDILVQNKLQNVCTSLKYYELYRIINFLDLPTTGKFANTGLDEQKITDFTPYALPLSMEQIKCAFQRESDEGYTPNKKPYKHILEILPNNMRKELIHLLKEELCMLGYYHYFKSFLKNEKINCTTSLISPHLTYSEFV